MAERQSQDPSRVDLLVHADGDQVAIAVGTVEPGPANVAWLDSANREIVGAIEEIPFGHKMALVDISEGDEVIEYGVKIGVAQIPVKRGELVHTHNLRSVKWQNN